MSSDQTKLAKTYIGGLAHVHTKLSNHPGHNESNLTLPLLVTLLQNAGLTAAREGPFEYVLINEHSSNPDRPKKLSKFSWRTRRLLQERRRTVVHGMPVLFGLEVSLLPEGGTDMTETLADHCAMIIASRHRLPAESEHKASEIMSMFEGACKNPSIDVLGHPMRNIEGVDDVDWKRVFGWAAASGTAIELNLNVFMQQANNPDSQLFWGRWLQLLGESKAFVFVGADLHNKLQVQQLTDQWLALDSPTAVNNPLESFLQALVKAGIGPERVVTADYVRLQEWLRIDKLARTQVLWA